MPFNAAALFRRSVLFLAGSPFFAAYALWRAAAAVVGIARGLAGLRRLARPTLPCPACGRECPTAGRWRCAECRTVYLGWAGQCPGCGSGCLGFACDCGATVPVGS